MAASSWRRLNLAAAPSFARQNGNSGSGLGDGGKEYEIRKSNRQPVHHRSDGGCFSVRIRPRLPMSAGISSPSILWRTLSMRAA